jgi:hypothetical protein
MHSLVANPTRIWFTSASFLSWESGSYLVSWGVSTITSRSQAGQPVNEAFTRRFDASGVPAGAPRWLARNEQGSGTQLVGLAPFSDGGYLASIAAWVPGSPATMRFVPYDSSERTAAIPMDGAPALRQQASVVPLALGGYLLLSANEAGPYAQILDDGGSVIAQPLVHAGTGYPLADGGFAIVWVDAAAPAGVAPALVQRYDALGAPIGEPTRAGPDVAPYRITDIVADSLSDVGLALAFGVFVALMAANVFPAAYEVVPERYFSFAVGALNSLGGIFSGWLVLLAGVSADSHDILPAIIVGSAIALASAATLAVALRFRYAVERIPPPR